MSEIGDTDRSTRPSRLYAFAAVLAATLATWSVAGVVLKVSLGIVSLDSDNRSIENYIWVWAAGGAVASLLINSWYGLHLERIWFERLPGLMPPKPAEGLLLSPLIWFLSGSAIARDPTTATSLLTTQANILVYLLGVGTFWISRSLQFKMLCLIWRGK